MADFYMVVSGATVHGCETDYNRALKLALNMWQNPEEQVCVFKAVMLAPPLFDSLNPPSIEAPKQKRVRKPVEAPKKEKVSK